MANITTMRTRVCNLTILTFALFVSTANAAQIEPGNLRIGAGIGGFTYSNFDVEGSDIETNEFSIGPAGDLRIGFVATELIEVGVNGSVTYTDIEVNSDSDHATTWRIGPYVDFNIPLASDGSILLAPGLGVSYSSLEATDVDIDGVEFSAGATLKFFVARNASLDVGLLFSYFTGDADGPFGDADADGYTIGPRAGISIWP